MSGSDPAGADVVERLRAWFAAQMPEADDVAVVGLDRASLGHSAETLLCTVVSRTADGERRDDVVVRICPPEPGLLPPYDLGRQFTVLRGLEGTDVRAPRARWREPTGTVLGRDFYVMERLPGAVYEQHVPDDLRSDPSRIRRMCEAFTDQLAAIHCVDLAATGLGAIADGPTHLDRELAHWHAEVERVRREPLPAFARLHEVLVETRPESRAITLVHGDAKPGNYAFAGDEVVAVFDWEMATVGDPLTDVGWAEILWNLGDALTNQPGAPTTDEFVARWEARTGFESHDRPWYRALESFKMCAIALVAGRLFDAGDTDDPRFASMTYAIEPMLRAALLDVGVTEEVETGPVLADLTRIGRPSGPD